jgi:hypothetical protein
VTPEVRRQLLVYARDGHLTEVVDVARQGLITAYRLPFWHYTTPLEVAPGPRRRCAPLGPAGQLPVRGLR